MFGKIFCVELVAWVVAVNISYGALNGNFSYEEMIEHKNYFQKCIQYDIPGDEFLTRTESFIAGNRELKAELNELEKYTLLLTLENGSFAREVCLPVGEIHSLSEKIKTIESFRANTGEVFKIDWAERKKGADMLLSIYQTLYRRNLSESNCARVNFWSEFNK